MASLWSDRLTWFVRRVRIHINEYGFGGALWKNLFVRPYWNLLTLRLMSAYTKGQRRFEKNGAIASRSDELDEVQPVVQEGQEVARKILQSYSMKYAGQGLRILVHMPPGGAGNVWMQDLSECLQHTGIPTQTIGWQDSSYKEVFEEFGPNVFISFDNPQAHRFFDLNFIRDYKERRGLVRMLSTQEPNGAPDRIRLSATDRWRLDLLSKGYTADVFFGLMDTAHYDIFIQPWQDVDMEYLPLPMAANPLNHYPRLVPKDLDWAIATNNCDWGARAELTRDYMWDIIRRYRGVIVGEGWGWSCQPMPHEQVPYLMARARICPSPRIDMAIRYPTEIGGKTFEVPAMGGFILVSRTAALRKFFKADEVVAARSPTEFDEKFRYFVARPAERYEYIKKAMRRVFREHTYFHRIDSLVCFLATRPELF